MSEAAADGAAIADLHVADDGGRLGKQRAFITEQSGSGDLSMSGQRADGDFVFLFADVIHAAKAADVDDVARRSEAELHQGKQTVAAGEDFRFVAVAAEKAQGFVERGGRFVFEFGRNHRDLPAFAFDCEAPLCKSCQIFSRLMGKSTCVMPRGARASTTALTSAGVAPMVPASPTPLTPMGFTFVGVTVRSVSIQGKSAARGIA